MHSTEIIEFIIVAVVIVSIIMITFFFKGRWRKMGWLLAFVLLAVYCIFIVIRPFWIDARIDKKVQLLRPYLEENFPDENWTISTVPHREVGYKHLNPYYIGVTFENEPEATYHYWVESKDHIYQISLSTDNRLEELKHLEQED